MNERIKSAIPSLVSSLNMFLGLLSCVLSSSRMVETAAWVIIYCGFLDKLDGILARAFKVSSPFGREMDSFCDYTSFGIAPAMMVWAVASGSGSVPLLWAGLSAFTFPLLAAVRLARFNLETYANQECFIGVPTTFAAMLLAALLLTLDGNGSEAGLVVAMTPGVAVLMVTKLRIPKLKPRRSRALNCVQVFVGAAVILVSVLRVMPEFLLLVGFTYLIVGSFVGRRMCLSDTGK